MIHLDSTLIFPCCQAFKEKKNCLRLQAVLCILRKATVGAKSLACEKLIVCFGVLYLALASSVGGSGSLHGNDVDAVMIEQPLKLALVAGDDVVASFLHLIKVPLQESSMSSG